jgi:GT2 family glycosyltransferase/glycosyltransferase involved in cell wall biosynthesis/regulator of replication initiation timing
MTNKQVELYDDPNRFAEPGKIELGEVITFHGYQKFYLSDTFVEINPMDKGLVNKKKLTQKIFYSNWFKDKSVLDLGANSAYFCFHSLFRGASNTTAVEMDPTYIKMLHSVKDYLNIQNFEIKENNIIDINQKQDIVFAFALIHWIYSCTSDYGSISQAIKKLSDLTNEVLVIEWIDPIDEAIQFFKHTEWNKEIITEEYTKENFEKALADNFEDFEYVGEIKETRHLYFAYKNKHTKSEIESSYNGLPLQDILTELSENGYPFVVLKNEEIILNSLDKFNDLTIDILTSEKGKSYLENLLNEISLKNQNGFLVYQFYIGEINEQKLYLNLKIISDKENYFDYNTASLFLNNKIKKESIFVLNNDFKVLYLLHNLVYYIAAGENTYSKIIKELANSTNLNINTKNLNNISYLFNLLNENSIYKSDENSHIANYSFKYINPVQTVIQSRVLCWHEGTFYISRIYKYLENERIVIQKQANPNIIKNEFELLNKLNSDYFPNAYDLKVEGNYATFKMDYIEGKTLSEYKTLKNRLNNNEIKSFILMCLELLSTLKNNKIIHRDISPGNIILRNNKPVLIDFGWAESNNVKSIDAPGLGGNYKPKNGNFSDLYSMGKVLNEMLYEIEEFKEIIDFMIDEINEDNLENINFLKEKISKLKIENPLQKAIAKVEEGKKLLEEDNVEYAYKYFVAAKQLIINKQAGEIGLYYLLAYCQFHLGELEKASENITTEMILNPDNLAAFELDEKINVELNTIMQSQTHNTIEKNWEYPVSVIIPVYNRPGLTEQCILSIYENTNSKFELIVVDNDSDSDTKQILKALQEKYNFILITNEFNEGFSKANNKAIDLRKGKHIFLLNNDTFVTKNWLDSSLELLQTENAGIVGSCLLYPDSKIIQHKGVIIGTEDGSTLAPYHINQYYNLNEVENQTKQFSAVTGAAFLINENLISAIGGLDEGYINGLEDIDYCFRATSIGATIWYNASSIIYHYESMSKDRHKHDIANWQRLNQKWLGKIDFDETQEQTIKNVHNSKTAKNKLNEDIIKDSINYEMNIISKDIKSELNNPYQHIDFSIIIPVHNNLHFTKKCIENIYKTSAMFSIEVIVIDNASTDETYSYLNSISDLVKIIKNDSNESFSKANNQGAEIAKGKYLVFLNNDVEVQPGWLDALEERFSEDENVAIQGAKLIYPNGLIQHCGVVWGPVTENMNLHYHIYLAANPEVEWVNNYKEYQMVTGALLAIRSKVFKEIEMFDEKYFFGHEDLDLCLKTRSAGYKVMYNPEVIGIHHESITKKSEGIKKFERFITEPDSYDAKNHKHFLSKWEYKIEVDAIKHYLEDGMYGMAGEPNSFKIFQEKLRELFEELKVVPEELYQRKAKRVSEILFNNPSYDFVGNVNILLNTSYPRLLKAIEFVKEGSFEDNSNKKLKILMTMFGWNESGGGTIFPRDVAIEYVKNGYDVLVFYAGVDDTGINDLNYVKEWSDYGVKLCGVYNRKILFTDPSNPEYEINDPEVSVIFEQKLDEFKPDLVHFHNFVGLSFNIAKIAKQKGYKTLYTPFNYHLIDPDLYMINSDLEKWENTDILTQYLVLKKVPDLKDAYINRIEAAKLLLNNYIDMTLAVSTRVKDILVEFGCRQERITIINQVPKSVKKLVKLDKNRKLKKPIKIGYIGGVMTHKGVHNLIVASSLLPANSAELNIYGFVDERYKEILLNIKTNIKVNL